MGPKRIEGRYDGVGQGFLTSSLLFYDESQSSLVDETPREGIYDSGVPSGRSIFRRM